MKIGLTGTMSVGKTTLVNALKELPQFKDYKFATERSKYLRDLGIPLNTDSTIKGQIMFLAERAAELMNDDIITDRTIIDVISFTKAAKSISSYDVEAFCFLASKIISDYDHIFYISPDGIDIEDNGVRTIDPVYRKSIDLVINNTLNNYKHLIKNFHILSGSTEERIKQMREILSL